MAFGPAYGSGGGTGAVEIFIKKDGTPAIFANTGARDTYFNANADEMTDIRGLQQAVGIGTANQITAAYINENNKWVPVATNFKGDTGATGANGQNGAGIDPSKLTAGSIPVWDATQQKLVDSGITSPDEGSIKMSPNSLTFGLHTMSSAIEDVTFTNSQTGKNFSPVWQELAPDEKDAWMRDVHSQETVVRVPPGTADVINPVNDVTIDADEVFLGGSFVTTQTHTNMELTFYNVPDNELIWKYELGTLTGGVHPVIFDVPFKVNAGYKYKVHLTSKDGDVTVKGPNAGTGLPFSWQIERAKFTDIKIASQNWVNELDTIDNITVIGNQLTLHKRDGTTPVLTLPSGISGTYIKNVAVIGNDLVITHQDDTTTSIDLSAQQNVSVNGIGLSGDRLTYTYTDGSSGDLLLPAASPKNDVNLNIITSNYTINIADVLDKPSFYLYKGTGSSNLTLPDTASIPTGQNVIIYVDNASTSNITTLASAGNTIETSLSQIIVPSHETMLLISDKGNSTWHYVHLEKAGGGTSPTGNYVTSVQTTQDQKGVVIYYSDNTSTTLSLAGFSADLAGLSTALGVLKNQLKSRTKFYVYSGSTLPTVPTGARGGYYLTFHNLAGNIALPAPVTASVIGDGVTYFVDNNDDNYAVNISAKAGETVDGKAAFQVPANTASWFVRNGTDWQLLYSGYLPDSYKHLVTELKASFLLDKSFLRNVKLQGDDPNTVLDCTSLEFPEAKIKADPNDAFKGIIEFPAKTGQGITFVNPDGSIHSNTKFKLVGMEIVDPGDGTPPKLIMLTNHNVPSPTQSDAYAFFSDQPSAPATLNFQSLPLYRGGRVTVHKTNTDPEYVYILLPPGQSEPTNRIGELGGLPAYWSKESKNYPVNGNARVYEVFRSPYPFHESDVTFVLYP